MTFTPKPSTGALLERLLASSSGTQYRALSATQYLWLARPDRQGGGKYLSLKVSAMLPARGDPEDAS